MIMAYPRSYNRLSFSIAISRLSSAISGPSATPATYYQAFSSSYSVYQDVTAQITSYKAYGTDLAELNESSCNSSGSEDNDSFSEPPAMFSLCCSEGE